MTDSSSTATPDIHPEMTMESILGAVPSAQRALFQRYHVGGCSACGFEPTDTLAKVCADHNILDVKEVVQTIHRAHEVDQRMQIAPADVKAMMDQGTPFRFLDVRMPEEWEHVKIEGAELLDYNDSETYMALPKDTRFVFFCKSGDRSLDVASYFIGHGFSAVSSMTGGLDGWRRDVDSSLPDYSLEAPAEEA